MPFAEHVLERLSVLERENARLADRVVALEAEVRSHELERELLLRMFADERIEVSAEDVVGQQVARRYTASVLLNEEVLMSSQHLLGAVFNVLGRVLPRLLALRVRDRLGDAERVALTSPVRSWGPS